jgi:hypothetical protein
MHRFIILSLLLIVGCGKKTETASSGKLPSGDVEFTAPTEWIAEPPSNSFRKAQFRLPGSHGFDAELAVFFFPGAGGSVEANLNRWYNQFTQPDGAQTRDKVEKTSVTANDLDVTVVYVTGTYKRPLQPMDMGGPTEDMPDYAMKAAIVETTNGPWFFKAVGPQATVDRWKESFDAFVQTFKIKTN